MSATGIGSVPGPRPTPLLGSRGNFIRFLRDPVAYMRMLQERHGPIAALVGGRRGMVFAFGPEHNRQLLSDPARFHSAGVTYPGPENSAQRRLGRGLFSMNTAHHREQRRLVAPPFHGKAIEGCSATTADIAGQMLAGWENGGRRDMARDMARFAWHLAMKIFFDLEPTPETDRLATSLARWTALGSSVGVRSLPVDFPGTPHRRLLRTAETLERQILALLARGRARPAGGSDVLSLLLAAHDQAGPGVSDDELIGHVAILLVAGHETTANALTWTLFLLAQHPRVMTELLDELEANLHGAAPTYAQLDRLKLLDAVIKESMRLFPPVVYAYRVAAEPFTLGPYELPARTTVALSHYLTHRMPDIYPEPAVFRPQRWCEFTPPPYAYLPFSAGPRVCLGAAFSMMTMRVGLAMMLQRFRFTVVPGAKIDRRVVLTLSPRHGMPMEVVPQDRRFRRSPIRGDVREMVDFR